MPHERSLATQEENFLWGASNLHRLRAGRPSREKKIKVRSAPRVNDTSRVKPALPGRTALEEVEFINHTWFVWGNLAADTDLFLTVLVGRDPAIAEEICARAVAAARQASHEKRDPKPDFYAEIFRSATAPERAIYLKDHPFTRQRIEKFDADAAPGAE